MSSPLLNKNFQENLCGVGEAFATFGELLQGVLPSDRNFLITSPVDMYSQSSFYAAAEGGLSVVPSHKRKSLKIVERILKYFGLPAHGKLVIESQVKEGKGMASSSSDIVSAARAVQACFDLDLQSALIEKFMSEIEPSDGVMYPGCVSYYQTESLLRSYLGVLPSLTIIGIDQGGEVDTVEFSQKRKNFSMAEKYEYAGLLNRMEAAVRKHDLETIARISTRSTMMNQRLKQDVFLDDCLEINAQFDCLGLLVAHSGTYLGILINARETGSADQAERVRKAIMEKTKCEATTFYTAPYLMP